MKQPANQPAKPTGQPAHHPKVLGENYSSVQLDLHKKMVVAPNAGNSTHDYPGDFGLRHCIVVFGVLGDTQNEILPPMLWGTVFITVRHLHKMIPSRVARYGYRVAGVPAPGNHPTMLWSSSASPTQININTLILLPQIPMFSTVANLGCTAGPYF